MTETRAELRARILATLKKGPALRFGSERVVDQVLQELRRDGRIIYEPKKKGGQGWRLVEATPPVPGAESGSD